MMRKKLLLLLFLRRRKRLMKRRPRSKWVREIFKCRSSFGEYHSLIKEMRLVDHFSFYRYFHMSPSRFDDLLRRVKPLIVRKTTQLREPVAADERLSVTLRYLVTGDSMQTISFSYRLGHSTVSYIIEETYGGHYLLNFYNHQKAVMNGKKLVKGLLIFGIFPTALVL